MQGSVAPGEVGEIARRDDALYPVGHSPDQYADAESQQLEEAGEKIATVVGEAKKPAATDAQVIELESAPGEIRTPDPQVRSQNPCLRSGTRHNTKCRECLSLSHLIVRSITQRYATRW
jgi:hypothetical protein